MISMQIPKTILMKLVVTSSTTTTTIGNLDQLKVQQKGISIKEGVGG